MRQRIFSTLIIITIAVTILLIFIGGFVRATGAGLGCPDWPKCFGLWIPPLDAAQLPAEYDASQFNVVHTWTEYVNRLVGVLVGFLILLSAAFSTGYTKIRKSVTVASFLSLVLVIFQGWLGGQVVRSGLQEGMITIHMIVAMLILMTLIYAAFQALRDRYTVNLSSHHAKTILYILYPLIFVTFIQIILGTQVREAIDAVDKTMDRTLWLDQVGLIDQIHRTFSWTVLALGGVLIYFVRKFSISGHIRKYANAVGVIILLQILVGVVLAYGGFPASFQIIHLGLTSFLIGSQFMLILMVRR